MTRYSRKNKRYPHVKVGTLLFYETSWKSIRFVLFWVTGCLLNVFSRLRIVLCAVTKPFFSIFPPSYLPNHLSSSEFHSEQGYANNSIIERHYLHDIPIVIDDISNPLEHEMSKELDYITCEKLHRLLSEILNQWK